MTDTAPPKANDPAAAPARVRLAMLPVFFASKSSVPARTVPVMFSSDAFTLLESVAVESAGSPPMKL